MAPAAHHPFGFAAVPGLGEHVRMRATEKFRDTASTPRAPRHAGADDVRA